MGKTNALNRRTRVAIFATILCMMVVGGISVARNSMDSAVQSQIPDIAAESPPRFIGKLSPKPEPPGYYGAAQGKMGADLLRSLHLIIRNGHMDRGYADARDALFDLVADADRDDNIETVYTGETRGPITDRKTAMKHRINAEHTWPQSKGASGIAKSDLHQLMPSDMHVNSQRGNYPFGVVKTADWTIGDGPNQSRLGVDELGRTVFEPRDSVKGDIARGLLYFYARYDHSRPRDYSLENFRKELPVLLEWSKTDPVTVAERQRNDEVFAIQGNRNPFIDHPDFIDKINFDELVNR